MTGDRRPRTTKPLAAIVLLLLVCAATSTAKYSGGSGEPNDPYRIATPNDLNDIGNYVEDFNKCFVMLNDINLADYTGMQFNIVGDDTHPFTGSFDGKGHIVSNFTYNSGGANRIGLFGRVAGFHVCDLGTANIKDLVLVDPNIDAETGDYVGSLVGELTYGGVVTGCYSHGGKVSGNDAVGGLVGLSMTDYGHMSHPGGRISQCGASCTVSGNTRVGGLVGENVCGQIIGSSSGGSVTATAEAGGLTGKNQALDVYADPVILDCYSTAVVEANDCAGGLISSNSSWGSLVARCYSAGPVTAVTNAGGLIGCAESSSGVIGCFWDVNTTGQPTSVGGTGKTTAEMYDVNTFVDANWDFAGQPDGPSDIWAEPPSGGYPVLWWQQSPPPALPLFSGGAGQLGDPYLISTAGELNSIGYNPRLMNARFRLVNDIDLGGVEFFMIGAEMYPFTGVFCGGSYEIANFSYSSSEWSANIGLFSVVEAKNAHIRSLGLVDPNVKTTSGHNMGSLVGVLAGGSSVSGCYAEGGTVAGEVDVGGLVGRTGSRYESSPVGQITNCYATTNVSGEHGLGGLVGANYDTQISCSWAGGNISGTGLGVGGLVGYLSRGTVLRCCASGDISGEHDVGGLVGYNSRGSIIECHASGSISGTGLGAGGLLGSNFWLVSDCYATGSVLGNERVGGLAGENYEVITDCYSTGSVSGSGAVGGLIGHVFSDPITTGSFWDVETSGQSTSRGGLGKTTAQMQTRSTFTGAGWDFVGELDNGTEDVWRMCWDGGWYPRLAWQFHQWADFVCPDRVDFKDFSYLAARSGRTNCADSNNCDGADLDCSGMVDSNDVRILTELWLKGRAAPGELAIPAGVDFADYAKLTNRWLNQDCWLDHNCYGTDLDFSGVIDWRDLKIFCDHWLEGL